MSLVREESSRLGAASPAEYAAGPEEFFSLLKPRVMSLVVLTALAGMLVAPASVHPVIGFAALLAISIGAGAAGALNMWWDCDIDALMARTRLRARTAQPQRAPRSRGSPRCPLEPSRKQW